MSIAYYSGCSAQGSSADYEKSTQEVCRTLGVEFTPINDWNCCGASPAHAMGAELSAALSVRNLMLAAKAGAERVATPCPSCLSNLRAARANMEKPEFRQEVNQLLDEPCSQDLPQTYSVLQLLHETFSAEAIAAKVKKPLKGLRVAAYYGCLLSRPATLMPDFGSPENPQRMEDLLRACGAEIVEFPMKTDCCGASMGIAERKVSATLSGRILQCAQNLGVDAIITACPLCQMNLDLRQKQAARAANTQFNIPVFYYTQMLGLAFGLSPHHLGLEKLVVSPEPVLEKWEYTLNKEAQIARAKEAPKAEKVATPEPAPEVETVVNAEEKTVEVVEMVAPAETMETAVETVVETATDLAVETTPQAAPETVNEPIKTDAPEKTAEVKKPAAKADKKADAGEKSTKKSEKADVSENPEQPKKTAKKAATPKKSAPKKNAAKANAVREDV